MAGNFIVQSVLKGQSSHSAPGIYVMPTFGSNVHIDRTYFAGCFDNSA